MAHIFYKKTTSQSEFLPTTSKNKEQTTNQTKPNQTKPNQTRPDQTKPNQTKPSKQTDKQTNRQTNNQPTNQQTNQTTGPFIQEQNTPSPFQSPTRFIHLLVETTHLCLQLFTLTGQGHLDELGAQGREGWPDDFPMINTTKTNTMMYDVYTILQYLCYDGISGFQNFEDS